MRVLAPEHVIATAFSSQWVAGLVIGQDWVEVPDYFVQVTSDQPENDVVHSKLVDDLCLSYTTGDGVTGRGLKFREANIHGTNPMTVAVSTSATTYDKQVVVRRRKDGAYSYNRTIRNYRPICIDANAGPNRYYVGSVPWVTEMSSISISVPGNNFSANNPVYRTIRCRLRYDPYKGEHYWQFSTPFSRPEVFDTFLMEFERFKVYKPATPRNPLPTPEQREFELSVIRTFVLWCLEHYDDFLGEGTEIRGQRYDLEFVDFPEADLRSAFILNEPEIFAEKTDPVLLGVQGGFNQYWREYLKQHALLSACEALPRLNKNSLQNIIAVVQFIKALVVDRKLELPETLQDAWLQYRYVYGTTKLDIKEAIKFVDRHLDLGSLDRAITSYGQSEHMFDGTRVVCRCKLVAEPSHLSRLKDIWTSLYTYGLTPNFYVVWDLIPYSFMVDWFLPISNLGDVSDANAMYFSGDYYTLSNIVYSLTYNRELDGLPVQCYTRWVGSVPDGLKSRYWLEQPSWSGKQTLYRLLDTASLILG